MTKELTQDEGMYYFQCPHCDTMVQVPINELNCRIFRHAVFKSDNQPINPHLDKANCDHLFSTGQIYGCAKPIQVVSLNNKLFAVACDYI